MIQTAQPVTFSGASMPRLNGYLARPEGDGPFPAVIVIHEAYVKIDEEGTEAAAATGVSETTTSAPMPFRVDRPYVFLLRDRLTGSVLFVGRIEDPTAG